MSWQEAQEIEDDDLLLYQELKKILPLKVKLDGLASRKNNVILQRVVEGLMDEICKVDPLFNLLYQRIYYTGSYYEGLRIKTPDEFDLNIVLKLPFSKNDRQLDCVDPLPGLPGGFAFLKLSRTLQSILSSKKNWDTYRQMNRFFETGEYLSPDEIRRWLQSCVDRAYIRLQNDRTIPGVTKIRRSQHGPANTLYITLDGGGQIDVDLVPVIQINWPEWPDCARLEPLRLAYDGDYANENVFWFLVPKPYPYHSLAWRIHFPEIEKEVLYNKGCVKPLIKLLKLLRDCEGWKSLASYYLKTVVLWEVEAHPDNSYWIENTMGIWFKNVLKKLQDYLLIGHLPNYFFKECSLIIGISSQERYKIANRIQRILKDIGRNPSNILEYFDAADAFTIEHEYDKSKDGAWSCTIL